MNIHTSEERDKDVHFRLLYLPSSLNLSLQQYDKAIRSNEFRVTTLNIKLVFMQNDILLFIQDPNMSLQETCNLISNFSVISNYTISWNKSTILPLSEDAWGSAT